MASPISRFSLGRAHHVRRPSLNNVRIFNGLAFQSADTFKSFSHTLKNKDFIPSYIIHSSDMNKYGLSIGKLLKNLGWDECYRHFSYATYPGPARRLLAGVSLGASPSIDCLDDTLKALHFLVTRVFLPRSLFFEHLLPMDIWILYNTVCGEKLSFPHLLFHHLVDMGNK
ncbi:hypothetical protein LINPERHAP2_LOCUS7605 [Linum perenne]